MSNPSNPQNHSSMKAHQDWMSELRSIESLMLEHKRSMETLELIRDQSIKVLKTSQPNTLPALDAERQLKYATKRIQSHVEKLQILTERQNQASDALNKDKSAPMVVPTVPTSITSINSTIPTSIISINTSSQISQDIPVRSETSLLHNPLASPSSSIRSLSLHINTGSVSRIIKHLNTAPSLPQRLPSRSNGSAPLVNASDITSPHMHALTVKVSELERRNLALESELSLLQSQLRVYQNSDRSMEQRTDTRNNDSLQVTNASLVGTPFEPYQSFFTDNSFQMELSESTGFVNTTFDIHPYQDDLESATLEHVCNLEGKLMDLHHIVSECFQISVVLKIMYHSMPELDSFHDIVNTLNHSSELFVAFSMILTAEKVKLSNSTKHRKKDEIVNTLQMSKSELPIRSSVGSALQNRYHRNDRGQNNSRNYLNTSSNSDKVHLQSQIEALQRDNKELEQRVADLLRTTDEAVSRSQSQGAEIYRLKALLTNYESGSATNVNESDTTPESNRSSSPRNYSQELTRTRSQLKDYKTLMAQAAQAVQNQDHQHKKAIFRLNEELKTLRDKNQELHDDIAQLRQNQDNQPTTETLLTDLANKSKSLSGAQNLIEQLQQRITDLETELESAKKKGHIQTTANLGNRNSVQLGESITTLKEELIAARAMANMYEGKFRELQANANQASSAGNEQRMKELEQELADHKMTIKKKHLLITKLKDELSRIASAAESVSPTGSGVKKPVRQSMISNRKSPRESLSLLTSNLKNAPPPPPPRTIPLTTSALPTNITQSTGAPSNKSRASKTSSDSSNNLILSVTEALESKTQTVTRLQNELDELRAQLDKQHGLGDPEELTMTLAVARRDLELANKEIETLNSRINDDIEKLKLLESDNSNLKIQHKEDYDKIQRLAKMVREYKTKSNARLNETKDLKPQLNENLVTLTPHVQQEEVQQLILQLKEANRVIEDHENEIAKLNMKLQRAKSAVAKVNSTEETNKNKGNKNSIVEVIKPQHTAVPPTSLTETAVPQLNDDKSNNYTTWFDSEIGSLLMSTSSRNSTELLTNLDGGIDNLDRSKIALGSSVQEIKNRLDVVELATLGKSSQALGDEGVATDPDISRLLAENRELRSKLDILLNQLAATSDIDYLRSQLSKLPTLDEIEQMRTELASKCDYEYIRAQLAELPPKTDIEAYKNELACKCDYDHIRQKLDSLPSPQQMDQLMSQVSQTSDYEYKHARVLELEPLVTEVHNLRMQVSATSDYEYKHHKILELQSLSSPSDGLKSPSAIARDFQNTKTTPPTIHFDSHHSPLLLSDMIQCSEMPVDKSRAFQQHPQQVQANHAPTIQPRRQSSAEFSKSSVEALPTLSKIAEEPYISDSAVQILREFEFIHVQVDQVFHPGNAEPVISRLEMLKQEHLNSHNKIAHLESLVNSFYNTVASYGDYDYLRDQISKLPTLQEIEQMQNELASKSDYEYIRAQLADLPSKPDIEAYKNELASKCDYEYICQKLDSLPSPNQIDVLMNKVSETADYEYKHARVLELEPLISVVNSLYYTVTSYGDYEYLRDQISNLPSVHEIEQMRNELALKSDYEYIQSQLAELPPKSDIEAYKNELACKCDYDHIRQKLDSLPSPQQMDQLMSQVSQTSDYEYKHARVLELEPLVTEVHNLRMQVSATSDYEYKHHKILELQSLSSPSDGLKSPSAIARDLQTFKTSPPTVHFDSHHESGNLQQHPQQAQADIAPTTEPQHLSSAIFSNSSVEALPILSKIAEEPHISDNAVQILREFEFIHVQVDKAFHPGNAEPVISRLEMLKQEHLNSHNKIARLESLVNSLYNNTAAHCDYEYLTDQISKLPTLQEIEQMRNELASKSDYEYIRAQLADLPSKPDIEAYKNELASKCDYEYIRQKLDSLPSLNQIDVLMNKVSETADYEYKHTRLILLEPLEVEVNVLRNLNASTCDYEYKHAFSLQDHTNPKPEELNAGSSRRLLDDHTVQGIMPDVESNLQKVNHKLETDLNTLQNQLADLRSKQPTLNNSAELDLMKSKLLDYENKYLQANLLNSDLEKQLVGLRLQLDESQKNNHVHNSMSNESSSTNHGTTYINGNSSLEQEIEALRSVVASQADYEYLRSQIAVMPNPDQVEILKAQVASQADYEYIRSQISVVSSLDNAETYKAQVANKPLQSQIAEMHTATEIEPPETMIVSQADNNILQSQIAVLPPSQNNDNNLKTSHTSQADHEYVRAQTHLSNSISKTMPLGITDHQIQQQLGDTVTQLLLTQQRLSDVSQENDKLQKIVKELKDNSVKLPSTNVVAPDTPSRLSTFSDYLPKQMSMFMRGSTVSTSETIHESSNQSIILDESTKSTTALQQTVQEKTAKINELERKLETISQAQSSTEMLRQQVIDQANLIEQLQADLQRASDNDADNSKIIQTLNQELDTQISSVLELKIKLSEVQEQMGEIKHNNVQLLKQVEAITASKNAELEAMSMTMNAKTEAMLASSTGDMEDAKAQNLMIQQENEQLSKRINVLTEELEKKMQSPSNVPTADEANDHIEALKEINRALEERLAALQEELDKILEKNMELVLQLSQ